MIPVIDLFAGPGGLGEGFSSLRDAENKPVFQTIMSIERDKQAHQTLRLRSYLRKIAEPDGTLPRVYLRYMEKHDNETFDQLIRYRPKEWQAACEEALCDELVDGDDRLVKLGAERVTRWFEDRDRGPLVLIGGPPCQAYSLVGRSRRKHDITFEEDPKHTLYRCYLSFINELKPDVFVMENVKGLLSAKHEGHGVFNRICKDMEEAGYTIHSLVTDDPHNPKDYVVKAEQYGIPQMRHRVILLGIKNDTGIEPSTLTKKHVCTLGSALRGLPKLRSGFSERNENWRDMNWAEYINSAAKKLKDNDECNDLTDILDRVISRYAPKLTAKHKVDPVHNRYEEWYRGRLGNSKVLTNHESRSHLASDLDRYLFCAAYAEKYGTPARLEEFPESLLPNHKNVQAAKTTGNYKFNDRFRVQVWGRPSTTITSHIAKDGHYYIHPDPSQCRSLTVREAARLQTFPDDYLFEGNRTSQYTQVGNAVPPLLAQQIAAVVAKALGKEAHGFYENLTDDTDCS